MPAKKNPKPSRSSTTRERSKSVGRAASKSSSRTRSRSRSRNQPASQRNRTPASESKVRRRRSPSSSPESSAATSSKASFTNSTKVTSKGSDVANTDKRSRTTVVSRDAVPSRFSQRIIEKIETSRPTVVSHDRFDMSTDREVKRCCPVFCTKMSQFVQEKVFPPSVRAAVAILTVIPLNLWLTLLVFSPLKTSSKPSVNKSGFPFAGVEWPTDWRTYIEPYTLLFVLSYYVLHILFARFVPIGWKTASQMDSRRMDYRCNGLASLILSLGIWTFAQWADFGFLIHFRPSKLMLKHWFSLFGASCVIMFVSSICVYVASRRTSRSSLCHAGNTGNILVDFWVGRSIRPRWFGLDWKMFLFRPSVIASLLVHLTYVCIEWDRYGRVNPAMALLAVMSIILIFDNFIFEHNQMSTHVVRYDGLGFLLVSGAFMTHFLGTLTASYVYAYPNLNQLTTVDKQLDYCNVARLSLSALLFFLGYWISTAANKQKALFWRQPNHPSVANFKILRGPHPLRLLAGGWWGWVRHPNFLGDILATFALSLPAGFSSFAPWFMSVFMLLYVLGRIKAIEQSMTDKYGTGYRVYTTVVPYRLIPGLY